MRKMVLSCFALVAGLCAIWMVAGHGLDRPVVYLDVLTGNCVAVQSADERHSCGNLPEQYAYAWADPAVPSAQTEPQQVAASGGLTEAERAARAWAQWYAEDHAQWMASLPADAEGKERSAPHALAPTPATWIADELRPHPEIVTATASIDPAPMVAPQETAAALRPAVFTFYSGARPSQRNPLAVVDDPSDPPTAAAVPEPASAGLLALAMAVMLAARRAS